MSEQIEKVWSELRLRGKGSLKRDPRDIVTQLPIEFDHDNVFKKHKEETYF